MSKKAKISRKLRLGNLLRFWDYTKQKSTVGIIINRCDDYIYLLTQDGKMITVTVHVANQGKIISRPYQSYEKNLGEKK